MALIEYDLMGNEINKVQTAIKRLQTFCPPEGYYLCFSGGKDSVCIKALADMAGVKYDAHYNVTTVDPPELVRFIAKYHPDVAMDKPERSMWRMIAEKGVPPTRLMRYCCAELKEKQSEGRICITGVRWAESTARKNNQGLVTIFNPQVKNVAERERASYKITNRGRGCVMNMDNDESRRVVEQCYRTNKTSVNPIIDWQDEDVWEFIHSHSLPYCGLYDEGYDRLGCIGCPMKTKQQRARDFAKWPVYRRLYIQAFDEMIKNRISHGLSNENWGNGEQCLAWWLNETNTRQIDGQMSMDELEGIEMEEEI